MEKTPPVAIVMGSRSDWPTMGEGTRVDMSVAKALPAHMIVKMVNVWKNQTSAILGSPTVHHVMSVNAVLTVMYAGKTVTV